MKRYLKLKIIFFILSVLLVSTLSYVFLVQGQRGIFSYEAKTIQDCIKEKKCSDIVFRRTGGKFIEKPDFSNYVSQGVPIKSLLYSNAIPARCAINVFQLKKEFGLSFNEKLLPNVNIDDHMKGIYLPWQSTPIHGKIDEMSKAIIVIASALDCLEDAEYKDIFVKHSKSNTAFFSVKPSNRIQMYVPGKNILFVVDYD